MARLSVLLIVLCQLLTLPIPGRSNEYEPLLDLASSFIQNLGNGENMDSVSAIGKIVGDLIMQGDNTKKVGGKATANGGSNTGDILAGLGSLLGGGNGKIDPSIINSMAAMLFQQMGSEDQPKPNRQKRQSKGNDMNIEGMLNMASGLLGNKNAAALLPMVMNTLSSFSNSEVQKRSDGHKEHASFLPPYLEKVHLYWDLFINSELGKTIWEKSGLKKAMKSFTGPDGSISFELMMKNFENQSFRRHWIKAAATWLTDMFMHVAKPEVYQRYMVSAQYIINSFLDAQGLPPSTHFNVKKPEKSITLLINHALKNYLDMEDTDVSGYVKAALDYVKQTLKLAQTASQSLSSRGDYAALADRLTDTLNLEVIEPVLRVYRAYRHSVEAPHCQEHLMCVVNRRHDQDKQGLPGFKTALTKLSSLAASAALSFQNGKGFWDLYSAIESDTNCEAKYPADCAAFHEHELKVTTEVYHSEL